MQTKVILREIEEQLKQKKTQTYYVQASMPTSVSARN